MITTSTKLRPVIFASNVAATGDFLAALGLWPTMRAAGGGWLEFAAERGSIAVHDAANSDLGAAPGELLLSFRIVDATPVAARVRAAGLAAAIVDESYGRALVITLPDGTQLIADADADDRYGYRDLPDGTPQAASIHARWPVGDPVAAARLVDALGAAGEVEVAQRDAAPRLLRGPDGRTHPAAAVTVLLDTIELLRVVAARLDPRGYSIQAAATELRVTGPDGLTVLLRPATDG